MAQISYSNLQKHLQVMLQYFSMNETGSSTMLSDLGCDHKEDFIEEIRKDEAIGSKVSRQALDSIIIDILKVLKRNGDFSNAVVSAAAKGVVTDLEQMIGRWKVYVPIENLDLSGIEKLAVGNVTMYPAGTLRRRLYYRLCKVINAWPPSGDPGQGKAMRNRIRQGYKEDIDDRFTGCSAIAEVVVEAESKAIDDLVDHEVGVSLNLLRCFTTTLQKPDFGPGIGIHGSLGSGIHHNVIFAADGRSAQVGARLVNGVGHFTMDSERLKYLRSTCAFNALCSVLRKPARQRSQMEGAIAMAIRWIGNGVAASEGPEKILCFCIELEQMMNGAERGDAIAERLATRVAFLLSNKRDERMLICRRAIYLYGLRSTVAHTGSTKIREKDIAELEHMAVGAMIRLAKHLNQWRTHDDFTGWVRSKQFG